MPNKINIQHVVLSLEPGGLENGVVNIVNGLNNDKFSSSVCCLKQRGEFADRIEDKNVSIIEMEMAPGNDYRLAFRMARHFRKTGVDIVHTRNQKAFLYGFVAAKLAGVKAIIHSEHGRQFPGKLHYAKLQRLFSRYTDAIVSVSDDLRQQLDHHFNIPKARIEVIYNGVVMERFADLDRSTARKKLAIRDNTIVIGAVGRLAEVKNYFSLLKAANELGEDFDILVLMVGDGPDREALENYAHQHMAPGAVRFMGHQDRVEVFMPAMDIFVLPSWSEGISNTLLEAMAAGVPIVASNVGGNKEIVPRSAGALYPAGDVRQMVRELAAVCRDPACRQAMGLAGKNWVAGHFTLKKMIDQYEALYQRVYDGRCIGAKRLTGDA
ncbi:MAG: glycosyltransferase [Gammaproteobacteria bacterium]|nr:glycosyltransferase [Gammaproteobacteria bacterium]